MNNVKELYESDIKAIKDLLFGRKVEVVSDNKLLLDNGLELEIEANEGCGWCSSGWYQIVELNGCDNVITNVEVVEDGDTESEYDEQSYKIFVFAEHKKIKLLQVDGDDGNGYYGTGYTIFVKPITHK